MALTASTATCPSSTATPPWRRLRWRHPAQRCAHDLRHVVRSRRQWWRRTSSDLRRRRRWRRWRSIELAGTLAPGSRSRRTCSAVENVDGCRTDAVAGGAGVVEHDGCSRHPASNRASNPRTTRVPPRVAVVVTPRSPDGPRQPVRGRRDPPAGLADLGLIDQFHDPFLLETSLPGVFATGDMRHGSVKRVPAAVSDRSVAIQCLHQLSSSPMSAIRGVARRKPPAEATRRMPLPQLDAGLPTSLPNNGSTSWSITGQWLGHDRSPKAHTPTPNLDLR